MMWLPEFNMVASIVTAVVTSLVSAYVYYHYVAVRNFPPVIRGYPGVGVLPWMMKRRLEVVVMELKRKHGDVFTMFLGMSPVVVLASYDAIKEALKQNAEVFSSRPWIYSAQQNTKGGKGVVMHQYGNSWKDMRKFTLQVLRDFGVGKTSLEDKILEEVDAVRSEIDRIGKPFAPQRLLQNAVSNIICSISFGNRYDYSNAQFQHILDLIDRFFKDISVGLPIDAWPWLGYIPLVKQYFTNTDAITASDKIHEFIAERVEEHRETFDADNVRDFIDLYLKAEKEGDLSKHINEEQLLQVIWDLFNAGTETTSTTFAWAMLYLCHHQDMQEIMYREIESAVGSSIVRMKDKSKLPFTNAFLLEVQRHGTIAPVAVAHCPSKDTVFRGRHISKDTIIFPMIWCAHRDEKYFQDPDTFNPRRWLSDAGEVITNEAFIPFSIGPRFCLGEQLAKMELFLFFTGLVQTYKFTGHGELPSYTTADKGATRGPLPYQVNLQKRY